MKKLKVVELGKFSTKLTADCVSFSHPYVLCGNYELLEKQQKRIGAIHVYQIDDKKNLIEKHTHMVHSGVFDLKFYPNLDHFSVALSNGEIEYMKLETVNDKISIKTVSDCGFEHNKKNTMCTSVDFDSKKFSKEPKNSCVSHSNGYISIVKFCKSDLKCLNSFKVHDYSTWSAHFDYHDNNILYSGGDDCKFVSWDVRGNKFVKGKFSDTKTHSSGVCCVASHPLNEYILATGCYDGKLRIWDKRIIKSPSKVLDCDEGGVWKAKWNMKHENLILTACMRKGFKILNVGTSKKDSSFQFPQNLCSYHETEKLAYGCEWIDHNLPTLRICSCSFYDKQLQYWMLTE